MKNIENWPTEVRSALLNKKKDFIHGCGSCLNAEWSIVSINKSKEKDFHTGEPIEKITVNVDLVLCRAGANLFSGNKLSPTRYCTMHNNGSVDSSSEGMIESTESQVSQSAEPHVDPVMKSVWYQRHQEMLRQDPSYPKSGL